MRILLHNIMYELVVESNTGETGSQFFNSLYPLRSRANALVAFLNVVLDDAHATDQPFARLYVRHLSTGKVVELLNSAVYTFGSGDLDALVQEFHMYKHENVKSSFAVYDAAHPHMLRVYPANHKCASLKSGTSIVFLADDHWLFTWRKKTTEMTA